MRYVIKKELIYKTKLEDYYYDADSIQSANQWGEKYYGEWNNKYRLFMKEVQCLEGISCYVKFPIEAFCGYGYLSLNEFLRNDSAYNSTLQSFSDALQIAICSAPKIPENIIVYRLVNDDTIKKMLSLQKAYIYYEKGFMSTSLYEGFYLDNDEHYTSFKNLLKIHVKMGTRAVYASIVDYRNEGEVLFLPNTASALIKMPYQKGNKIIYECVML